MCELFGMSSRHPATVRLSLDAFARHGGGTGPHRDGWGIAYYDGCDARLLREPAAAVSSACVAFLREHPFTSRLVVSHIRLATQGARIMANTQPFARELGGSRHVFAHNGDLAPGPLHATLPVGPWRQVGDTDSEFAFGALLEALRPLWTASGGTPPLAERAQIVAAFAARLRPLGPANFLYADGDAIFAHAHRRRQADGTIAPPGLHMLHRRCVRPRGALAADGLLVSSPGGEQEVTLFASVPLSDEPGWTALAAGELVAARAGIVIQRIVPAKAPGAALETS